jgi:hypothetical protein
MWIVLHDLCTPFQYSYNCISLGFKTNHVINKSCDQQWYMLKLNPEYMYFYQILTVLNKLKSMSEVAHDNWKINQNPTYTEHQIMFQ